MKVEESRSKARECFKQQQEVVKRWFDKHKDGTREFEVGDLVLKWDHPHDEKGKHMKFQQLWVGPFQIAAKLGPSTYRLRGQYLLQYGKGPPITVEISCVFLSHHGGGPT